MHNFLPKQYYFIDQFDKKNIDKLKINTGIIYRNYTKKLDKKLVLELKYYCKKKKLKFFISNNFKVAHQLKLDGAYIPSFNKSLKHLNYSYKKNFELLGSAHNLKEIKEKEQQKVKKIFISSLFKKNKNYLGINKLKLLSKLTNKDVVVLGGISKENIRKLKLLNIFKFAGISFFEQKKGP